MRARDQSVSCDVPRRRIDVVTGAAAHLDVRPIRGEHLGGYRAAVAIYLVRHGHAGDRSDWTGDDVRRPLSAKGRRQADHVADLLADRPVKAIFTSPAVRCIETVTPLADQLGLGLQESMALIEGADVDAAIRFALEHAEDNPVLCSHGDVIPQMLRRLGGAGMRGDAGSESRKGSVWTLELEDGDVVRGTYSPPQD